MFFQRPRVIFIPLDICNWKNNYVNEVPIRDYGIVIIKRIENFLKDRPICFTYELFPKIMLMKMINVTIELQNTR